MHLHLRRSLHTLTRSLMQLKTTLHGSRKILHGKCEMGVIGEPWCITSLVATDLMFTKLF
jgi:hypothetical protein